jgi:hypothetical protein
MQCYERKCEAQAKASGMAAMQLGKHAVMEGCDCTCPIQNVTLLIAFRSCVLCKLETQATCLGLARRVPFQTVHTTRCQS